MPVFVQFTVPILLYNSDTYKKYMATPSHAKVRLSGLRKAMSYVDFANLALHINLEHVTEPKKVIRLQSTQLLLPNMIDIIDIEPTYVTITIEEQS